MSDTPTPAGNGTQPTAPRIPAADAAGTGRRATGSGPTPPGDLPRPDARPAGGRRLRAAARRAQLLEVAIAVFGRRGFRGATTQAIAAAAGVSEATIFRHFPSKADLYVAAFRQRTEVGTGQLVTVLQEHARLQDDEGLLRTLIDAILLGYAQDRDLHRMLLYAWLDQDATENRRMWKRMRESPLFAFLESWIAERQSAGAFGPGDPALLGGGVLALPVQYAIRTRLYRVGPEDRDKEIVALYARLLLNGLRRTGAPPAPAPTAG